MKACGRCLGLHGATGREVLGSIEEWAEALSRDNHFRHVDAAKLRSQAGLITADLNDVDSVRDLLRIQKAIVRRSDARGTSRRDPCRNSSIPPWIMPCRSSEGPSKSGSFGRVTEAF